MFSLKYYIIKIKKHILFPKSRAHRLLLPFIQSDPLSAPEFFLKYASGHFTPLKDHSGTPCSPLVKAEAPLLKSQTFLSLESSLLSSLSFRDIEHLRQAWIFFAYVLWFILVPLLRS